MDKLNQALWSIYDAARGKCYYVEVNHEQNNNSFAGMLIHYDGIRALFFTPRGLYQVKTRNIEIMEPRKVKQVSFSAEDLELVNKYEEGLREQND